MIRSQSIQDLTIIDVNDPLTGILSAVRHAVVSTVHTTLQATPMQLVFGRDAMLNIQFEADWQYIKKRKQEIIDKNNQRENSKRVAHQYQVGDKVLKVPRDGPKFGRPMYEGPFTVIQVNDNGTLRLQKGTVSETVNIRLIKPYYD